MSDEASVIAEAGLVVLDALRAHFFEVRAAYAANVEARLRARLSDDPCELTALMEQRKVIGRELNAAYRALREITP